MKSLKSLGMVMVLAMALGMGAGCSKKNAEVEVIEAPVATVSAVELAAQQISDGIILFDFNKYDIKAEYREVLQQAAELMKQHPSIKVRLEGHCDARGTQEYNLALGERRALAAKEYLLRKGIADNRIRTVSYGEEKPAGNDDAQNRRDEFIGVTLKK